MAEQCYLGIDLGAESGRVVAGLFDGSTVRLQELHRFPNGPVNVAGTLRWNVLSLWSEIQRGLSVAAADFRSSIASVGIDTWGVDYVLMTKEDEILGMPYNYRDARTEGMLNYAFSRVPREQIFAETGLQFMEINTLYQLLAMKQQSPKLLELADRFLMIPDYFNWLLSGSRVVEFTNATTTQCFHAGQLDWSFDMLRRFELPISIFGDVVPPGTNLGSLRQDLANRCGLPRFPVIAPATHDTGSAVAAIPTEKTGETSWAYISSGTWSLMGVEVREAVTTPQALEWNVTNEGGVDGTYRLLKNIMGLWLVQECRRSFERKGHSFDYAQLMQMAADAAPFRSLVDPDDAGFLKPSDMAEALQRFCRETSQPVPETEGQLIRCALESLALKYRLVLQRLEKLTQTPVDTIHIVGGGCQNELLNQFTASACGCRVVTGPVEATVLGNVLIQARSAGQLATLAELREVVRRSSKLGEYEPADKAEWIAAASRFSELLGQPRT